MKDGKADAVAHFDKQDPAQERAEEVPATATYCSLIYKDKQPFRTARALMDERLKDHAARDAVQSYCGVPILDLDGRVQATLCFYDSEPRDVEQVATSVSRKGYGRARTEGATAMQQDRTGFGLLHRGFSGQGC